MISIIVPVYKNEDNIPPLLEALETLGGKLGGDIEIVFVVDGSPDQSLLLLQNQLPLCGFNSQLINLSRNFGSFAAIFAGMEASRGDYIAVMAADLQEPLELIQEFFRILQQGDFDIVVGERRHRADPLFSRLGSTVFWWLYRRLIIKEIPYGGIDIFACNRRVRDQLVLLREAHSSLVGLLFWVGFRRIGVPYDRAQRAIGKSAWTFQKKWNYLLDSIYSFSDLPITLLLRIGVLGIVFSFVFGLIVLIGALAGAITVPGYAATILVVLFIGAVTILAQGIVGVYVWRTFENSKNRPGHIVSYHANFAGNGSKEVSR